MYILVLLILYIKICEQIYGKTIADLIFQQSTFTFSNNGINF